MEVRGFEPRTFRMQSGRSTTELHPREVTGIGNLDVWWIFLKQKFISQHPHNLFQFSFFYNNFFTLFFRVTFLESCVSYAFVEKKSTFTFTVQNMTGRRNFTFSLFSKTQSYLIEKGRPKHFVLFQTTGQSGKVNFNKQGSSFPQLLYCAE